ncbi:MAG TPA: hypothetical protein VGN12_28350 [Pirellulales bacterium]|jgi:hypothetical protein
MRPWLKEAMPLFGVLGAVGAFVAVAVYNSRPSYPYGRSHSCLKGIGLALQNYSDTYGGRFPVGESSSEASLSLLYREHLMDAETLRGKTVPLHVVQKVLERGELLGPKTCGWHYVEGLKTTDDPRIAIVWDKIGLGHNGQTLPEGGHSVLFIRGSEEVISGRDWETFLAEQEKLLSKRKKSTPSTARRSSTSSPTFWSSNHHAKKSGNRDGSAN